MIGRKALPRVLAGGPPAESERETCYAGGMKNWSIGYADYNTAKDAAKFTMAISPCQSEVCWRDRPKTWPKESQT